MEGGWFDPCFKIVFMDSADKKEFGGGLEIQKIKGQIRSLKRANDRDLLDIGRMAYEKFQKGEISDLDCISLCEAIETRSEEIERQEEEIVRIKGVF